MKSRRDVQYYIDAKTINVMEGSHFDAQISE